jgi:hypothetical protein
MKVCIRLKYGKKMENNLMSITPQKMEKIANFNLGKWIRFLQSYKFKIEKCRAV